MNRGTGKPVWLASRSPRRRLLLEQAGIEARVRPPEIDDAALTPPPAVAPAHWVMALAYLKGRFVLERLRDEGERSGVVLAADTVCVVGGEILGQPRDADHARRMLGAMRNAVHRTLTGVALLDLASQMRRLLVDAATVRLGDVTDRQIDEYLASGDWQGKAGAYNLAERIDAGWPIRCDGDPTTVMGLPMGRLLDWLAGARQGA